MFDLCYLYLFTYTDVQTGLPYHVIFVSFNSNLIGATSKADTDYPTWAPGFTPALRQQKFEDTKKGQSEDVLRRRPDKAKIKILHRNNL
jgi:hypothetical protein